MFQTFSLMASRKRWEKGLDELLFGISLYLLLLAKYQQLAVIFKNLSLIFY